jgi:DNA-directed RNA polymerase subunit RPC12/RpoP
MFEKVAYRCPRCGFEISEQFKDGTSFVCTACSGAFRVMLDEKTGKVAFYEEAGKELPEPLYLPRGSIRALVGLAMAVSCWVLIFAARDVPSSLLSLMLTILGYYFAFRTKVAAASRIYDPSAREQAPLFLPGGAVRWLLILGFLASGLYLYARGGMKQVKYFEFFVILLGLVLGYVFGRISARGRGSSLYLLINHVKGIVVLAAAGLLTLLLVTGLHAKTSAHQLALCAVVSFYYGSRT